MPTYSLFQALPLAGKEKLAGIYYHSLLPHVHQIAGFRGDAFLGSPATPRQGGVNVAVWDDVHAIGRWRDEANHLRVQGKGPEVYEGYRLRIGESVREGEIEGGGEGARHYVTLLYADRKEGHVPDDDDDVTRLFDDATASALRGDMLDSAVYADEQTTLWISSWRSADAVARFRGSVTSTSALSIKELVVLRILRDYTKTDRRDAPSETPGGQSSTS